MMPLLEVRGLCHHYPQHAVRMNGKYPPVHALDGVDFTLASGEVLGIVGESGCGKSTLGRVISRLEPETSGDVLLSGEKASDWTRKSQREYHKAVQLVFQNPFDTFNPRFTIFASMERALILHSIGANRAERFDRCKAALEGAGMRPAVDFLRRMPIALSGGQLQRISILRAMMLSPRLLIADEPLSMLDVSVRAEVLQLLVQLKSGGMAMLLISHDLATTRVIADRVAVMYLGRIVEIGPVDEVLLSPMHPYTQALVSHAGALRLGPQPEPIAISGEPPMPIGSAAGCSFQPRCPKAMAHCEKTPPPAGDVGQRRVTCHLIQP